jgi:hypothetical protein
MECGGLCGAVFLDLSTASVRYSGPQNLISLHKLKMMVVPSGTVDCFESYVSNRIKKTYWGSELSDALPVTFAVP